jgi:uncharacterized lipoprotein YmbA
MILTMRTISLIFLTLSLLFSGCVNLKPKPDHTQVFTLAADVAPVLSVEGKPECYVARVELPGFLEDTRIYYRLPDDRLGTVSGARWAEAPNEALPRAIAIYLQATEKAHVRAYHPWANSSRDVATISVQFERFSANAAGRIEVVAQWQIKSPDGMTKSGRYLAPELVWNGQDASDYVAQLNVAIAGLAQAISNEL